MVILAYVAFGLLFAWLAATGATSAVVRRRLRRGDKTDPTWISAAWYAGNLIFVGLPAYFIGSYLRLHGDPQVSTLVLVLAGTIGIFVGTVAGRAA